MKLVGLPHDFSSYGNFTAVATDRGYTLLGALSSGSAIWSSSDGFGILGSGSSLSEDLQTAFPGHISYSPTGDVWTSIPFAEVGIEPSVPSIAVNSQGAIISMFVPGQPLKLLLVTLETKH